MDSQVGPDPAAESGTPGGERGDHALPPAASSPLGCPEAGSPGSEVPRTEPPAVPPPPGVRTSRPGLAPPGMGTEGPTVIPPFPRRPQEFPPAALVAAAFTPRKLADHSPALTPKVCREAPRFYYYFRVALVYQSWDADDRILCPAFRSRWWCFHSPNSHSRSLKTPDLRTRSLPARDTGTECRSPRTCLRPQG